MYRTLLPIFVCTIAVAAAPQDPANSDITYVKIKPVVEDSAPPAHLFRESRIENLPLTIPGNVSSIVEDKNPTISADVERKTIEHNKPAVPGPWRPKSVAHRKPPTARPKAVGKENPIKNESNSRPVNEKVLNDDETHVRSENDEQKNPTKRESNSSPETVVNDDDDVSDETNNSRQIRSEDSTESYETETVEPTEANTESVEELIQQTEVYETRTKAPTPRFLSKLSYFKKEDEVRSSIATNLVERNSRRKFKSKCRCEKIWNCGQGKLQITVPRCPNEYFLCCF
ncbi:hypothetical protein O0L34_g11808 [Tuta absoluta]|nr:hypothetical protein O0L34_g11808 [Tuta absoluta]